MAGSTRMLEASRVTRRTLFARAAVVTAALLLVACSSTTHGSARSTTTPAVAVDPRCPLTRADAVAVLGDRAAAAQLPLLSGVEKPIDRCEYAAGGGSLELTVFAGQGMLAQLRQILAKAELAPDLGPGAYCNDGKGDKQAAITCIFLKDGNTHVLGLLVPNAQDTASVRSRLRSVARAIASAPTGTTSSSA